MMIRELQLPTWNSTDDGEMCWRIRQSGMPLDDNDARLIRHLFDECGTSASVYDLHRLNMLCHQAIGYLKAKSECTCPTP